MWDTEPFSPVSGTVSVVPPDVLQMSGVGTGSKNDWWLPYPDAAYADALKKLIEKEEDEIIAAGYKWGLTDLESKLNPVELSNKQMKQYVGQYGPRRIFIEGDSTTFTTW